MSRKVTGSDETRTLPAEHRGPADAHGVRIAVIGGPDAGVTMTVSQRKVLVGRSAVADIRLSDPKVSSFHLELWPVAGGIEINDLKSLNGTRYAGARIRDAIVPVGAVLDVGDSQLRIELDAAFQPELQESPMFGELRGRSAVMRELFSTLSKLARTDLSVLVEGGTGTGKELAARAVHEASLRRDGPFVVLDCTAIPANLAESMMFGYEKGAFTGASERRAGVFEAADGGTIFLDEIGEMPLDLQPKLLRVLERREFVRVGGTQPEPVQVRVVCATWRDLRGMINEGRFREDLYYRIAQARVSMPSLQQHPEDIKVLVYHFLQQLPRTIQAARAITPEALEELLRWGYPGNVRQLKSIVERAAIMAEGTMITPADLAFERILMSERDRSPKFEAPSAPPSASATEPKAELVPFKQAKRTLVDEFERDYLRRLLTRSGGVITRAAALAGLERHHLRDLFRKHGLLEDDA